MSRPLPPGDPVEVGPFRLSARLSESAAGIVFLGVDGAGRRVCVAVLNRGAAGDAAARDRFRAAIVGELPRSGGAGAGGAGLAPVVAASAEGAAPWVATAYESGAVGAERFLEAVVPGEGPPGGGRWHGPRFQPYWAGSGGPALAGGRPVAAPVVVEVAPRRGLVAGTVTLALGLLVVGLLVVVLFACRPEVSAPPPLPPEPTPLVPEPSEPVPTPSPSSVPSSPGPVPSDGDPAGGGV